MFAILRSSSRGAFPRSLLTSVALHAGVLVCGALVVVPALEPDPGARAPADLKIGQRPVVEERPVAPEPTPPVDLPEPVEPELRPVRPVWTDADLIRPEEDFELPPDPSATLARVTVSFELFLEPEPEPEPDAPDAEPSRPEAPPAASEPIQVAARPTARPDPPYPALSVRFGEAGTVRCRLLVDATGRVERVEIVRSSGHRRLDESARKTLATWRFEPATTDGRPHATTVEHDVEFRLRS